MASRSYLYSLNYIPGGGDKPEQPFITGVSEFRGRVPLVYRLLMSANPRPCDSKIFNAPHKIAFIADYEMGLARLARFLKQIPVASAKPIIAEALTFLESADIRSRYFLLEPAETYELEYPKTFEELQPLLLEEILRAPAAADEVLASLREAAAVPGIDLLDRVFELGLGYWSTHLYFSFKTEKN